VRKGNGMSGVAGSDEDGPGLRLTIDGPVATILISNPARRNAMTLPMWQALPGILDRLADDVTVRVVVLTGAGDTFCAGADINDLGRLLRDGEANPSVLAEERLAAFPKPTVAALRGHCVGGGCQLAVACDLRIAATGTRLGVPPARLGVVYPAATTRRLVQLVGPAAAKQLIFTGELIDTGRATAIGLVDEVVPAAGLTGRVAALATTIAGNSQLTIAAAKEFIGTAAAGQEPDPARVAYWHGLLTRAGDVDEGVAAFAERRTPRFGWTVPPAASH
jgi:enoyl-CoA hydratase/carnithine racemase